MKKVIVGSNNPVKNEAVHEVFCTSEFFKNTIYQSKEVKTSIREQPISLLETIRGAQERAWGAFEEGAISVGLESGLVQIPETKSGYMDMCVCAIYDGKEYHLGISSAFDIPKNVARKVCFEGKNLSVATKEVGLTTNDYVGYSEGIVGILTKGRVNRKEYTKQALIMALIHLENQHLYS